MYEILKRKEKEPENDDVALMLHQGKVGNPSWRKDIKTCYYCGKPGHIACFCYEANNTKDDDDYSFATQHEAHSEAICN